MPSIFEDELFTLTARDSNIILGFTLSEIESLWKVTKRYNVSIHNKIDQFIKEWQRRLE